MRHTPQVECVSAVKKELGLHVATRMNLRHITLRPDPEVTYGVTACTGRTRGGKAAGTEGSCVAARGWGQGEGIGYNGRKETFMMVGRMS